MDPCTLCGGEIGPDITGRLMCYGCGPVDMIPVKPERLWKLKVKRMVRDAGGMEVLERTIRDAMERVECDLSRALFPIHEGPASKPPAWHWHARRRIAGWWYSVRARVAEKVLRVEVAGEEDW